MQQVFSTIPRLKIQTKLVIYYVTFALITLAAVIYFAYTQAIQSLKNTVEDKLNTVAVLKQYNLNQWVDEQQRNAVFLANLPELRSLSGKLLNPESSVQTADLAHRVERARPHACHLDQGRVRKHHVGRHLLRAGEGEAQLLQSCQQDGVDIRACRLPLGLAPGPRSPLARLPEVERDLALEDRTAALGDLEPAIFRDVDGDLPAGDRLAHQRLDAPHLLVERDVIAGERGHFVVEVAQVPRREPGDDRIEILTKPVRLEELLASLMTRGRERTVQLF